MVLKRAHGARSPWQYDWADWSAALVSASLAAPSAVAAAIDDFGRAIDPFLTAVAARNSVEDPLTTRNSTRRAGDRPTHNGPWSPPSAGHSAKTWEP
jgi:hypothetical protein